MFENIGWKTKVMGIVTAVSLPIAIIIYARPYVPQLDLYMALYADGLYGRATTIFQTYTQLIVAGVGTFVTALGTVLKLRKEAEAKVSEVKDNMTMGFVQATQDAKAFTEEIVSPIQSQVTSQAAEIEALKVQVAENGALLTENERLKVAYQALQDAYAAANAKVREVVVVH